MTPIESKLTEEQEQLVRLHLQKLLNSQVFRNSKRYPRFLEKIVKLALRGELEELKERALGHSVFDRAPDYDTAEDPVVRITAGEVRKRLAQYYQSHKGPEPVRIFLPIGTYLPTFEFGESHVQATPSLLPGDSSLEEPIQPPTVQETTSAALDVSHPRRRGVQWISVFAGIILTLLGLLGYQFYSNSLGRSLNAFWSPILDSPDGALLLIAHSYPKGSTDLTNNDPSLADTMSEPSSVVAISDARAFSRVCALVTSNHKNCNVLPASETPISQLRSTPVVLVGLCSNIWSLRLQHSLPFQFGWTHNSNEEITECPTTGMSDAYIFEAKTSRILGRIETIKPIKDISRDYGIIARFDSDTTGKPIVLIGGLSTLGTEGAGEFSTKASSMAELENMLPKGKMSRNIEAVIETTVIDGRPGGSKIVAVRAW